MERPINVLFVEDMEDDAALLFALLGRAGFDVVGKRVDTTRDMRAAFRRQRWDVVVSDYNMPQMDIEAALKLTREFDADVPLIVVSGAVGEETAVKLMRAGAADLILKSNLSRLVPAIERELTAATQRRARKEGEQRFRDIAALAGDWIWETDERHAFTYVSSESARSMGLDPGEFLGKTLWNLARVDLDRNEPWRQHKGDMDTGRPFRGFRCSIRNKYGKPLHLSVAGIAVVDATGAFRGYRGTATNETDVVEARWRAERSEALLRNAIDSMTDGFAIYDSRDCLILCNESYRSIYHMDRGRSAPGSRFEEILRAGLAIGLYPDAKGREEAWLAERLCRHRKPGGSVEQPLSDGRWFLITEHGMSDGGIAGLGVEITALKNIDPAKRQAG